MLAQLHTQNAFFFAGAKKILFMLGLGLLALSTPACVATNHALLNIPSAANTNRLPALESEVEMGALVNTDATLPEDLQRLFQNELDHNLADPTGAASFGRAHLAVTQARVLRKGRVLQAFQVLTMLAPSVLGLPLETYQTTLTAKLQIRDARGTLLGEYVGKGQSKVMVAIYYGYSQLKAPALSDAVALRMALAQIRPQLDTAANRLRPLLLASGPTDATESTPRTPTGIMDIH